jgi:hypothetical protein
MIDLGDLVDAVDEPPHGGDNVGVVGNDHGLLGEGGAVGGVWREAFGGSR